MSTVTNIRNILSNINDASTFRERHHWLMIGRMLYSVAANGVAANGVAADESKDSLLNEWISWTRRVLPFDYSEKECRFYWTRFNECINESTFAILSGNQCTPVHISGYSSSSTRVIDDDDEILCTPQRPNSPSVNKSESATELTTVSSLDDMFINSINDNRSREDVLKVGSSSQKEPVLFPVSRGGGYLTTGEVKQVNDAYKEFKPISLSDEMAIIREFSNIKNMNFYEANSLLSQESPPYSVHAIYVNDSNLKFINSIYDPQVIGVRVCDPSFNYDTRKPSDQATITDIIDVGGKDLRNVGSY